MNANVMKTNNGKLLAAVVAMLMIVCAVAVVASPATAEDAVVEKPTYDFSAVEPIEIGGDKTVAAALGDAYYNGVLTVTEDMVLNITGTVGSSTAPAIEQIVLNGGDLQITGTGVIYIGTDAKQNNVSVVAFQSIGVLQITGAVKVNFDAAGTNCHIFNNSKVTALVSVTNGAELNITQTGSKGASWYNSDETANTETFLDVDGATVNLTNAHSIQGAVVSATNSATITVDNERDVTGITLKDGSVIDNSKITVTKSGYSGVLVKGTVKLNNSASIEVKESGVFGDDNKYPGINMSNKTWGGADVTSAIVMDDTSSVTTTSIGVCHENSSETLPSGTATITGGTFTGAFAQGNNSTAVSYTLNTTIAGSSSADSNVTINGVAKVTGTLDASDATVAGKLIAMPKSNVTVETNDADNVTAMAGSTVNNVVTSPENVDYEVTVTT